MSVADGMVAAVAARGRHGLGKDGALEIALITGEGVAGDAHCGITVKHRSRVARDPSQPNLRQVHLIHAELLEELAAKGFGVAPGELGENILTQGIGLLDLPLGATLRFPSGAAVELTGLRNPCQQLNGHTPGLMEALLGRAADGALIRKCGVMGVVRAGGPVRAGDPVAVELPPPPFQALGPV